MPPQLIPRNGGANQTTTSTNNTPHSNPKNTSPSKSDWLQSANDSPPSNNDSLDKDENIDKASDSLRSSADSSYSNKDLPPMPFEYTSPVY
ncbi:hypothetical protein PCANC_10581 [Puccinia coronata f. sp. avenae]|uniref:Uncharacterized protein n=1 Tax=Puccinia coronata f. sp. avenae TaxID=200324 RepID=A0A2N5VR65_9BASI|nr:hypothetical protein PCANC_10581 [Puccinia coronata f. sp. avenae]